MNQIKTRVIHDIFWTLGIFLFLNFENRTCEHGFRFVWEGCKFFSNQSLCSNSPDVYILKTTLKFSWTLKIVFVNTIFVLFGKNVAPSRIRVSAPILRIYTSTLKKCHFQHGDIRLFFSNKLEKTMCSIM